ncbi:putative regulator PrlF [compost metagenome]
MEDPAVSRFLHFLEMDVHYRPDRLKAVDFHLLSRINLLVDQIEVDLNAALFAEDE